MYCLAAYKMVCDWMLFWDGAIRKSRWASETSWYGACIAWLPTKYGAWIPCILPSCWCYLGMWATRNQDGRTRSMPAVGCQIITATACFSRMELYNYERQRRVITRTPYVPEPNSGDQLKNTSEPCYVGINGRMLVASSKTIFCHRCHR